MFAALDVDFRRLRMLDFTKMPPYASHFGEEFVPGDSQVLYSGPYWDHREIEMAMQAFLTGKWVTAGEYVARFQNMFGKRFRTNFCHMVNSGSSANLVMIASLKKNLGWQDGDEVIVSPVGFPTTIAPLVQCGLNPVFVDIEMETLNFDVEKIYTKISKRTKAIFVSPVLGNPPDMNKLLSINKQYGVLLIGDNCDSLGSKWNGKYLNELYYAWTTSFYPAHHITTGEGGMICSNYKNLIDTARSISWWGRDCYCVGAANLLSCGTCGNRFDKWLDGVDAIMDHKYVFTNMGYNMKPLDLQGAIGLAQLEKIDEIEQKRRTNYLKISKLFAGKLDMYVPKVILQSDPCWFGVPIVCSSQNIKEELVSHFEANGIQTRSYFAGNILQHPAYKHLSDYKQFPNANLALTHVFFLGCPPHYTDEIISYIGKVLSKWHLLYSEEKAL
jgi:CDP-4-dehydro-6-deoxyglucose reductase, E1